MIRLGLPLFAAERWPTWFSATRRASGSLLPKCAKAAASGAAASPSMTRTTLPSNRPKRSRPSWPPAPGHTTKEPCSAMLGAKFERAALRELNGIRLPISSPTRQQRAGPLADGAPPITISTRCQRRAEPPATWPHYGFSYPPNSPTKNGSLTGAVPYGWT